MLNRVITFYIKLFFPFFILAVLFGIIFAAQLVGLFQELIPAHIARSLHISLMLYGFVPLAMSVLPFALFEKDGIDSKRSAQFLELYFITWGSFLVFMVVALLLGNLRDLPFYDYPYELNFLLAFSGLFYFLAIMAAIKEYEQKPLWVKVSLAVVVIAPFALVLLMNPQYGQVEQMHFGPHGDNTLGMSFALFVIIYLAIKLESKIKLQPRYNILWLIPLLFYISSVVYRTFVGSLSYEAEWFFQYLTLLFIPMLYVWIKDAKLEFSSSYILLIAIAGYVFVDIEGNILFIPEIRSLFHRNDLVVAHSHVAVVFGMFFLSLSIVKNYFSLSKSAIYTLTLSMIAMVIILSINGFAQAGIIEFSTLISWNFRLIFGIFFILPLFGYYVVSTKITKVSLLGKYHFLGFLSDGLGGLALLLFGSYLYNLLGETFAGSYQYVVFGFVFSVGLIHLIAFFSQNLQKSLAIITVIVRVVTASLFFSLFKSGDLGYIALIIALYDLMFASIYFIIKDKNAFVFS